MGMMYANYRFKNVENQKIWQCIYQNTFESMELYYRKQFNMRQLLSNFRKAFHIAPVTLKNSQKQEHLRLQNLAIYLLTKYSKESHTTISKEFKVSMETVNQLSSDNKYQRIFQDDIKMFFKNFEDSYLLERKSSMAFSEEMLIIFDKEDESFKGNKIN
jgi:hypothetical protein